MMLSCYRSSEASDPETFVTAVAAVLARYPQSVASCVANPSVGLPSRSKWLPSVAEVREDCERLMAPHYAQERRDRERAKTASITSPFRKPQLREVPANVRQVQSELAESLDPSRSTAAWRTQSPEQLAERYAATPLTVSEEMARFVRDRSI